MSQVTTELRKESHEFGPFTVEIWECPNGQVAAEAKIMGWLMLFRKRNDPFDTVKADVKEILIDAMRRYQRAAQNWDSTQTSTRP